MNILITGASGFLGSKILEIINKLNNNVFITFRNLDQKSLAYKLSQENKIIALKCDINDINSIKNIESYISKCDVLINATGYMPETKNPYDDIIPSIDINIRGIMNLVTYMKNLKKIIQISTTDVYGTNAIYPILETYSTNPQTYYAISKLTAEKYLERYSYVNNITLTILRMSIMYGEGEWHNRFIPNCIKSVINNEDIEIYGNGEDRRSYLYINDAAQSVCSAIGNSIGGIFNIASEISYSKNQITEKIIKLSGKNLKIIYTHPEYISKNLMFNISKAKRILSFYPYTDIVYGLTREIEWMQNQSITSNRNNNSYEK